MTKRIKLVDSKTRSVDPTAVAKALGAEYVGPVPKGTRGSGYFAARAQAKLHQERQRRA